MDRLRILIADDDREWTDLVCSALSAQHECYCACDGLKALNLARKGEPDLILLDILMPVMDGLEFLRRARLLPELQKIPVIALTALASREQAHAGYKAGVRLYLTKPIELPRLRRNIELFVEDNAICPRPKRLAFDDLILSGSDDETPMGEALAPASPPEPALAREDVTATGWDNMAGKKPARAREDVTGRAAPSAASPVPEQVPLSPDAPGWGGRGSLARRPERPAMTKPAPAAKAGRKASVLLAVEDQETTVIIGAGIGVGLNVINVSDGVEAAELAVRHKPSLFIIDEKLSRMNGHQLLHVLRKEPAFRQTPIIFISNKSDARCVQRALQEGVDYCLARPFPLRDLLKLIERALGVTGLAINEDDTMVGERSMVTTESRVAAWRRELAGAEQESESQRLEQELRKRHGASNEP